MGFIETFLIGTVLLFFFIVVISKPINNFIRVLINWRDLVRFIKAARGRNIPEFKINTTSNKIIITTNERDKKLKSKRIELIY